jgi:hypothetical protein
MTLPFTELERVYERLATAIDEAGPDKSEVFLSKLVLMLAQQLAEPERALAAIETCLKDL